MSSASRAPISSFYCSAVNVESRWEIGSSRACRYSGGLEIESSRQTGGGGNKREVRGPYPHHQKHLRGNVRHTTFQNSQGVDTRVLKCVHEAAKPTSSPAPSHADIYQTGNAVPP